LLDEQKGLLVNAREEKAQFEKRLRKLEADLKDARSHRPQEEGGGSRRSERGGLITGKVNMNSKFFTSMDPMKKNSRFDFREEASNKSL